MNKIDARQIFENFFKKELENNILSTDYIETSLFIQEMSKEDFINKSNEIGSIFDIKEETDSTNAQSMSNNFWSVIDAFGAEEIFGKIDKNGDGILGKDEIHALSNIDGNNENLSIYDLQDIIEEMDSMMSDYNTGEITTQSYNSSNKNGHTYTKNYNTQNNNIQLNTEEDYSKEISNQQTKKNKIKEETDAAISAEESKIQEALRSENSGISEEAMNEYITKTQVLDAEIEQKDTAINEQKTIIQDSTAEITAQRATISKLETQIESLKSSPSYNKNEDDNKIKNLEEALSNAIKKKETAETNKKNAEEELKQLESDKKELQGEKEQLKDNLIEENKATISPEVQEIITTAKNEIKSLEAQEKAALEEIDSQVQNLKTGLSGLKTDKETAKVISENSILPTTDEELARYGFDTEEKREGFRNLTPEMKEALVKLTDFAISQGIQITYSSKYSIFRTRADQELMYRQSKPGFAAKPGTSRHESGEAVDISIPGANSNNPNDPQYKLLAEYWQDMGYTWGGNWENCEPWHFDIR